MLFPQWVATLDFSYASRWPMDKSTGKPVLLSPEVRQLMNKEEMWRDYNKTLTPSPAKRQAAIQQWLPWIAVGLVALVGVYFFINMQAFQKDLAAIYNQLNAISK
jgi:hypothetical protein